MAAHGHRLVWRHRLAMLGAAVVVVCGSWVAWVASRPPGYKACVGGMTIDEVGAVTPEAARVRWNGYPLEIDIEHPDRVSGSGDRATAIYVLPTPEADWGDPDHTYFREVITERGDDDVWRVVGASKCEQWTGA